MNGVELDGVEVCVCACVYLVEHLDALPRHRVPHALQRLGPRLMLVVVVRGWMGHMMDGWIDGGYTNGRTNGPTCQAACLAMAA